MDYEKLWKKLYSDLKESIHEDWHKHELLDYMETMEEEQRDA